MPQCARSSGRTKRTAFSRSHDEAEREVPVDDRFLPRRRRAALGAGGAHARQEIRDRRSLGAARARVERDAQVPVGEIGPAVRRRREQHAAQAVEAEGRDPALSGQAHFGVIAFDVHDVDTVLEEDGRDQVLERGGLLPTVAVPRGPVKSGRSGQSCEDVESERALHDVGDLPDLEREADVVELRRHLALLEHAEIAAADSVGAVRSRSARRRRTHLQPRAVPSLPRSARGPPPCCASRVAPGTPAHWTTTCARWRSISGSRRITWNPYGDSTTALTASSWSANAAASNSATIAPVAERRQPSAVARRRGVVGVLRRQRREVLAVQRAIAQLARERLRLRLRSAELRRRRRRALVGDEDVPDEHSFAHGCVCLRNRRLRGERARDGRRHRVVGLRDERRRVGEVGRFGEGLGRREPAREPEGEHHRPEFYHARLRTRTVSCWRLLRAPAPS